jgi:arabinofuranosyltransferase
LNWLAALPILLAFLLRLIPGLRIVDDAYITFRYAQNLAAGHGLVFNAGEAVLGTTTPLYAFILACLSSTLKTDDLPQIAYVFNALLDAGGTALVFWIGKRATGESSSAPFNGLAASFLWAAAPFSVTFAIGGLETSLVILLLLASFACYLGRRDSWAAAALALGVLVRPDVLIAAAAVFGFMGLRWLGAILRRRRDGSQHEALPFPWRPAAVFVVILLPWIIYAAAVYGSPIPNSLAAKSVAYHLPPEAALVRLLQHFATPFHGDLILGNSWIAVGLFLYGSLFAIGSLYVVRREKRAWPLVIYPILYAAVYAIANPLMFRWYLSPPVPLYFLGVVTGIRVLAGELEAAVAARRPGKRGVPRRLAVSVQALLVLLALASLANAWTRHPPGPPDRPAPEMAWIRLEELYREVAMDLKEALTLSGGRLAAGDIGTLGWYTGAPILDLVGLISPQAMAYYPLPDEAYVINYAVSTDLVLAERPEYIVILEVYGRETLARSDDFLDLYRVWRSYPTDIYGSTAMLVYELNTDEDGS